MALSQRDIVITPNRGASTEPVIKFTGADASSSATITLRVINSSTVGTLSFEGTSGQLFSVTDSMVGTIFTVNDVSGIPSIEVLDTGLIKLAQYNGQVTISTATSISGAKLTVQGGVYVNGTVTATNFVGAFTGSVIGAATQLNATANTDAFEYIVGVAGSGSAQNAVVATTVPVGFNASTGYVGINTTSPSTRLVIDTGATTDAGAQLLIGPSSGTAVVGDKVIIGFKLQNTAGGGTGNTYAAGIAGIQDVSANNGGALGFYTQASAGDGTPERMRISTVGNVGINTTGARSKFEVVNGTALVDDDPAGYAASFVGPTGANQYATVSIASNDTVAAGVGGTLSFGGKYNSSLQNFANWAAIKGLKTNATSGDYGGYLSFHTRLTGANSLERLRITGNGGISFGATGTAYGSAGNLLQSNGDAAPTWVAPGGLTVSVASNAINIRTISQTANAAYYPTFVNSNNAANAYELLYTTATFVINPMTSNVGIGTTAPRSHLDISDGTVNTAGDTVKQLLITAVSVAPASQSGLLAIQSNDALTSDVGGSIAFGGRYITANTNGAHWAFITGFKADATSGNLGGYLAFSTRNAAATVAERLRITQNGGIAFGGAANYGTSGQVLKSNGDAAPTWVNQSTVAAGSAPLTNTYVGFGSASNLLTGSANLTWSGSTLNVNGAQATATTGFGTRTWAQVPPEMYLQSTTQAIGAGGTIGFGAKDAGTSDYLNWRIRSVFSAQGGGFGANQALLFDAGTDGGASTALLNVLTLLGNGNVAIGATSTLNKFEVSGTQGQLFSVSDSFTGTIFAASDISGIPSIEVIDTGLVKLAQYNGQVSISTGTAVSGSALTVYGIISTLGTSGEIRASSEITAYYSSDARLKENISVISDPIAIIKQINGVYFDWTAEHIKNRGGEDGYFVRKRDIGVIAQEVEKVLPEVVATRADGFKAVKYEKLVALLIEAVKSQQTTIEILTSEMEEIKEFILSIKEK